MKGEKEKVSLWILTSSQTCRITSRGTGRGRKELVSIKTETHREDMTTEKEKQYVISKEQDGWSGKCPFLH